MNTSIFGAVFFGVGFGVLLAACGGAESEAPATAPAPVPASVSASQRPARPVTGSSAGALRAPPGSVLYSCGMGGLYDEAGTCPGGQMCMDGACVSPPPTDEDGNG